MYDLRRASSRRYYRRIFVIQCRMRWKMIRLALAWQIMRLAFLISPDAKDAIESKLKPKELW